MRGRAGTAGRHRPRGPHGNRGARRHAWHRGRDLRRHAAAPGPDAGRARPGARRRRKRGDRAHREGPGPVRLRAHHQGRRRLAGRDRRGSRRHRGPAGDRGDQFRLLRLRRRAAGRRGQADRHQQRAGPGVPHRRGGDPARRRPPGGHGPRRRPGRDPGRERPGSARPGAPRLQRPAARGVDAGRGHDHGPVVDLGGRGRDAGARRGDPARHSPGGADRHRARGPDRPRLRAQGYLGRRRTRRSCTPCASRPR